MGKCLIAPVRAEHVESVKGRAQLMGRVQLAASDAAFFEKLQEESPGLPVYLFPTKHAVPGTQPAPGICVLTGVLEHVGQSPDPSLRPDATSSDTDWNVYWTIEVTDGPVRSIGEFKTAAGKAYSTTPRRPLIAYL